MSPAPEIVADCFPEDASLPSGRLLVISPHMDDAVLSCGNLIASHLTRVVTVFAGHPPEVLPLTPWDASCGFGATAEVTPARRDEDVRALAVLGATPLWLDFLDAQYGATPSPAEITTAIEGVVLNESPDMVCIPLGLFHSDHILASDASLQTAHRLPGIAWVVYSDAIYRAIPDLTARRLAGLRADGWNLAPLDLPATCAIPPKRRAIDCYASQLRGLAAVGKEGHADALRPEQYWRLDRDRHV